MVSWLGRRLFPTVASCFVCLLFYQSFGEMLKNGILYLKQAPPAVLSPRALLFFCNTHINESKFINNLFLTKRAMWKDIQRVYSKFGKMSDLSIWCSIAFVMVSLMSASGKPTYSHSVRPVWAKPVTKCYVKLVRVNRHHYYINEVLAALQMRVPVSVGNYNCSINGKPIMVCFIC